MDWGGGGKGGRIARKMGGKRTSEGENEGRVGYKHRSINSGIKAKPCFFLAAKREMVKM